MYDVVSIVSFILELRRTSCMHVTSDFARLTRAEIEHNPRLPLFHGKKTKFFSHITIF